MTTDNVVVNVSAEAKSGPLIWMSRELLDDEPFDFDAILTEYMIYGQPRKHRNFMPHIVLFPRVKRLTDWLTDRRQHYRAARSAWKYGWPEENVD